MQYAASSASLPGAVGTTVAGLAREYWRGYRRSRRLAWPACTVGVLEAVFVRAAPPVVFAVGVPLVTAGALVAITLLNRSWWWVQRLGRSAVLDSESGWNRATGTRQPRLAVDVERTFQDGQLPDRLRAFLAVEMRNVDAAKGLIAALSERDAEERATRRHLEWMVARAEGQTGDDRGVLAAIDEIRDPRERDSQLRRFLWNAFRNREPYVDEASIVRRARALPLPLDAKGSMRLWRDRCTGLVWYGGSFAIAYLFLAAVGVLGGKS